MAVNWGKWRAASLNLKMKFAIASLAVIKIRDGEEQNGLENLVYIKLCWCFGVSGALGHILRAVTFSPKHHCGYVFARYLKNAISCAQDHLAILREARFFLSPYFHKSVPYPKSPHSLMPQVRELAFSEKKVFPNELCQRTDWKIINEQKKKRFKKHL